MKKFLSVLAGALVIIVSSASVKAAALTDNEYYDLIDKIKSIEVDPNDPGDSLETIHLIDQKLQRSGSDLEIYKDFRAAIKQGINNSPAELLFTAMEGKVKEGVMASVARIDDFGDGLDLGRAGDVNAFLATLYVTSARHFVGKKYSNLTHHLFADYGSFITSNIANIERALASAGIDKAVALNHAKKLYQTFRAKQCVDAAINMGVLTSDVHDQIASSTKALTMAEMFCPLMVAKRTNDKIDGQIYSGLGNYTLKLTEKGKGSVVIKMTKGTDGRWISEKINYYGVDGKLTKSEKVDLEGWTAAMDGLYDYWVKTL